MREVERKRQREEKRKKINKRSENEGKEGKSRSKTDKIVHMDSHSPVLHLFNYCPVLFCTILSCLSSRSYISAVSLLVSAPLSLSKTHLRSSFIASASLPLLSSVSPLLFCHHLLFILVAWCLSFTYLIQYRVGSSLLPLPKSTDTQLLFVLLE